MNLALNQHQINQKLSNIQEELERLTNIFSEKNINEEQFITIKEVSDLIGFNPDWIYKRIANNEFPSPIKIGRASRWRRSTISQWKNNLI